MITERTRVTKGQFFRNDLEYNYEEFLTDKMTVREFELKLPDGTIKKETYDPTKKSFKDVLEEMMKIN